MLGAGKCCMGDDRITGRRQANRHVPSASEHDLRVACWMRGTSRLMRCPRLRGAAFSTSPAWAVRLEGTAPAATADHLAAAADCPLMMLMRTLLTVVAKLAMSWATANVIGDLMRRLGLPLGYIFRLYCEDALPGPGWAEWLLPLMPISTQQHSTSFGSAFSYPSTYCPPSICHYHHCRS